MSRQRFGMRLSSAALDFYGTCEEIREAAFHQSQERKARPLRLHSAGNPPGLLAALRLVMCLDDLKTSLQMECLGEGRVPPASHFFPVNRFLVLRPPTSDLYPHELSSPTLTLITAHVRSHYA